ncbi:chemotaxis protein MotB [Motilibacter peucedani]|uniref:Chemotaxis protein MotB n=1 Tax=Motilibacter peucedani TaxID=598650 RepID=A0A420XTI1_9ACTN|nr:flagellar motor protein MotB [Motilibacter peucedani]RKS80124.1 chemotaxis protein MotB [Motilibacter peucedani]
MSGHAGHAKGKKHKGGHEEEHENHERWVLSYADMLTLLFVLFVVLYAISSVNQQKFDALKDGMAKGFGSPLGGLSGSTGVLNDPGTQPQAVDMAVATVTGAAGSPSKAAVDAATKKLLAKQLAAASEKAEKLEQLKEKLDAELTKKGLQSTVNTRVTARGVVVTVITNEVVFEANSAVLRSGGQKIIHTLAPVLRTVDNDLSVEGNTDTTMSSPKGYASEYNLAGDRACNVVNYLARTERIDQARMTCTSNGKQNPLYPGTSAEANTLNRRVEIVVLADAVNKDSADSLSESEASKLAAASTSADADQQIADEVAANKKADAGTGTH